MLKVREIGRVVGVHTLIAAGVNAEGYREILGVQVTSAGDSAGWMTFFRDLVARGQSGVGLVTSDSHGARSPPNPLWPNVLRTEAQHTQRACGTGTKHHGRLHRGGRSAGRGPASNALRADGGSLGRSPPPCQSAALHQRAAPIARQLRAVLDPPIVIKKHRSSLPRNTVQIHVGVGGITAP